jgi:hypothetical protein
MRRAIKVLPRGILAALIAVNVVLLFMLFRPDRVLTAQPADQGSSDGGLPTVTSSPGATSSPSTSSGQNSAGRGTSADSTPSVRPVEPAPAERLLLATSSTTAWRATVGDCNTPGKIERSTDGGASWKGIVRTGSAPIVILGAEPGGDLFTIGGTGQTCSVRSVAYASDGTVIASSTSPANEWFSTPHNRDQINGPGGTRATPCEGHVVGLAPLNPSRAVVICDSGAAMSSRNSGNTWRQLARIPNTLAVSAGSGTYWLASTSQDCDGVTVQSLTEKSGDLSRGRTRCARGLGVASGQVAFDVTGGGTIWLWSGDRVAVSKDGGKTWT